MNDCVFQGQSAKYIYKLSKNMMLNIIDKKTGQLIDNPDEALAIWNELDKAIREKLEPPKEDKPKRRKYGEFGWVRLTDDEKERLDSDLGITEAENCINYVDELAETNGNKYKWKSWNIVVRKCHREQWHKSNVTTETEEEQAVSYDMAEFEKRAAQLPVYKKRADR